MGDCKESAGRAWGGWRGCTGGKIPLDVRRRGLWTTDKESTGRARVGKASLTEEELPRQIGEGRTAIIGVCRRGLWALKVGHRAREGWKTLIGRGRGAGNLPSILAIVGRKMRTPYR